MNMSNLRSDSFSWNGATVTVRGEIGWDDVDAALIHSKVFEYLGVVPKDADDKTWNRVLSFSRAVNQSEVKGSLGFEWPTAASPVEKIGAAYEAFGNAPRKLISTWTAYLNAVNTPPNDPDLLPPEALTSGQRSDPLPPGGEPSKDSG